MPNTQPRKNDAPQDVMQDALLVPAAEVEISAPQPEQGLKAAIKKPATFISGALQSLKGNDLEALIEEFSDDVTLVLGGLSDDQERLGHELEQLRRQNAALEKRVKELERKAAARPEKEKDGLIRRLTWLAAVVFGGAALLYVIRFLFA
ncbi:MAG: hypothetical protein FWE77_03805 [Clostridia bacterium]|nr:hypothetical protein [Clostridia bacterium]